MTPVALTIAGFDTSCGAGLQADLKTMVSLGVYGLTAATCIVSETANEVTHIEPIAAACLREQIDVLLRSYPIGAVKLGMLYDLPQMEIVAAALESLDAPIICDPVMIASSGAALLRPEAMDYLKSRILPLATIITPNAHEAAALIGRKIDDLGDPYKAATKLSGDYHCVCVLKGGHIGEESDSAIDLIAFPGGRIETLKAPRLEIHTAHGTGCTFAAAVAAELAKGADAHEAAKVAKAFVSRAISSAHHWTSHGISAINQSPTA